ncbi:recombinase family protein [Nocardioides sp. LHG3406-4]|uniref:recombinase family protein n=1 Tax=Nocardioides sp. LHG3406-4 TaxID=2804575 RepID=UPI003CFADD02
MIGYTRISDSEQSTDGLSLDTQRKAIEQACSARGWELFEVFEDDGYTGRNDERPALQRARAMLAKRNRPDALVVSRLDRLTRSLKDLAVLIEDAEDRWGIVALDFDLNTTTANGELVAHILGAVARWESRMNSERTSAGMKAIHAAKRAKGEAFGFQQQADAATVKHILRLRAKGATFAAIARALDRSTPTPGGGVRWYPSTVERICKRSAA